MVLLFFSKICSVPITINHTIHAAGIFTYAKKKKTIQINKFMVGKSTSPMDGIGTKKVMTQDNCKKGASLVIR